MLLQMAKFLEWPFLTSNIEVYEAKVQLYLVAQA